MNNKQECAMSVITGHEQHFPFRSQSFLNHFSLNLKNILITVSFAFILVQEIPFALLFMYCKYHSFSFNLAGYHSLSFNLAGYLSFLKITIHYCSCLYLMRIKEIYHSLLLTTTPFQFCTSFFYITGYFGLNKT